jgi:hypothetical protein
MKALLTKRGKSTQFKSNFHGGGEDKKYKSALLTCRELQTSWKSLRMKILGSLILFTVGALLVFFASIHRSDGETH